jgi:hypothetical protein
MSDYSADAHERSAEAIQTYPNGSEIHVELSYGFIRVDVDGERVFHAYSGNLKDNPEDRVAERLSNE